MLRATAHPRDKWRLTWHEDEGNPRANYFTVRETIGALIEQICGTLTEKGGAAHYVVVGVGEAPPNGNTAVTASKSKTRRTKAFPSSPKPTSSRTSKHLRPTIAISPLDE
jgi:hypothetical protein